MAKRCFIFSIEDYSWQIRILSDYNLFYQIISIPKDKRTGEAKKQYDRLVKVTMLLESSLMNLDDAIMLFHDF